WRGSDYVGVGPGAHGRLTLAGRRVATEAAHGIEPYIAAAGQGLQGAEPLSAHDVAVERVLMGLRTDEGVAMSELTALSLRNLPDLVARGMLMSKSDRLIATLAGRAVLDRVTADLAA